jgi:hypothetical protein
MYHLLTVYFKHRKVKAIPVEAWTGPEGSRMLRLPECLDNLHMKAVRLAAIRTGHLYLPGHTPGTHFCQRLSRPQSRSAAGRINSMKNSSDTSGNRSRDFPACSAEPQPTVPSRAPVFSCRTGLENNWLEKDCRSPVCSVIEAFVWHVWEKQRKFSGRIASLLFKIWNRDLLDIQKGTCPLEN